MNQYFNAVKKIDVLDKGYVELWSGWNSNINEDSRIETVTTIASLSYGNEAAKNPKALYERLWKDEHLVCFEFIRWGKTAYGYRIYDSLRHKDGFCTYEEVDYEEDHIWGHKESLITLKIKMPIFVARQIMRHRVSMLEMSRRYTTGDKVEYEFYNPFTEATANHIDYERMLIENTKYLMGFLGKDCGLKQETARIILPLATYTTVFMMFDKDQLENFLKLRLDSHTQEQTREYAQAIKELWDYQQGVEI